MKLKFISLFFLFSICALKAQIVKEGEEWQNQKSFYPLKFLGIKGKKLLLASGASEKGNSHIQQILIEGIDTGSLKLISSIAYSDVFNDKLQFYPEDVILWNGDLVFLGSSFDKKTKNNSLLKKNIGTKEQITESTLVWEYPSTYFDSNNKRFRFTANKEQSLLLAMGLQMEVTDKNIIHFAIIDQDFIVKKQINAPIEVQGKNIKVNQFSIDGPGNVQVLIQYQRSADSLDLGFSLFAFPIMTEEVIEYQLDLPDKQIMSIHFELDENEHLKIGGLYQMNYKKTNITSGSFYMDINRETGEIENKSIVPFNSEFLGNFLGEGKKLTKEDFKDLKIKELLCQKDGGVLLFAEQANQSELCETDFRSGLTVCKNEFTANNIIIIKFNKNASVEWFQWIFKKQHSYDDDGMYLSFNSLFNEKSALIFSNKQLDKKKQYEAIEAKMINKTQFSMLSSFGQLNEVSFDLKSNLPILKNIFFTSNKKVHFFLESNLISSNLLRINN